MMKKELFKFIKCALSREAMKSITAGTFDNPSPEDDSRDEGNHRTNGLNKEMRPQSLSEAYRRLSRREGEVLEKIVEGKTNREIAGELYIAKGTVENHITRIGKALGVQGRGRLREWVARQKNASDKI